jgi:hypothetical protein
VGTFGVDLSPEIRTARGGNCFRSGVLSIASTTALGYSDPLTSRNRIRLLLS